MFISKYKNYLINISLILFSTIFALAMGEIFLWKTQLAIPDRMETSIITGLIAPSYPDFYRFVPGAEATVVSRTCEFSRRYKINSLGMLDREHSATSDGKQKRILFIGDSFTEGVGVGNQKPYPQLIQKMSNDRWECLNAGMRGTSPSYAYFRLKKFIIQSLDFDFVVFQFFNNDFNDDQNFTEQFQLKISSDQKSITRAPFHECIGNNMKTLGPFAYPLSQTQWFWLVRRLFVEKKTISPYTITTSKEKADTILKLFLHSNVSGIQSESIDGKQKLTFPILPKNTLLPEDRDRLWLLWKRPHIKISILETYKQQMQNMNSLEQTKNSDLSLKYLNCLKALCDRNNIPFAIYSAPAFSKSNITFSLHLQQWCHKNGVNFFYPLEPLVQESLTRDEAIYHSFDGHMAPKGHHIVANEMASWLNSILD